MGMCTGSVLAINPDGSAIYQDIATTTYYTEPAQFSYREVNGECSETYASSVYMPNSSSSGSHSDIMSHGNCAGLHDDDDDEAPAFVQQRRSEDLKCMRRYLEKK